MSQSKPANTSAWAALLGVLALQCVVFAFSWPEGLSFADEVGYLGQAKLLAQGRITPVAYDPGIWLDGPHGPVGRYPLSWPLLMTPLCAITPRASFLLGLAASLCLAYWASRLLASWDRSPLWAAVVLTHPSVLLLARTLMADLALAALSVGAWLALRRGRARRAALGFAFLTCLKPTGGAIAVALLAGELLRRRGRQPSHQPTDTSSLRGAALGGLLGVCALLGLNFATTGSLRFAYQLSQPSDLPMFGLAYLPKNLTAYLPSLLLCPPLLPLGALALWRRRELGALAVVVSYSALMLSYFFVDQSPRWIETLVLAPRLLLPVVAVLLVGYADGLAGLSERLPKPHWATRSMLCVCVLSLLLVAAAHTRWQAPMAEALNAATRSAAMNGVHVLTLTHAAQKQGLLFDGPTRLFDHTTRHGELVLCSRLTPSHRERGSTISCQLRGYHSIATGPGYHVLLRDELHRR